MQKRENQQRSRINKAFKKIPRFDGTNPSYCFDWLEQTEALVNEHHRQIYREELLLNCGTSVSKTIHALPQGATNQCIKDAVLRNHSNLRTVSQRSNAYHQLHQKPDEALQSYNTRYASFFNLAYPELELDNPLSKMHCIHYASSLYGKLGDEMTGRFNQDLPENLQTAFEKAMNFEPQIITKQSINSKKCIPRGYIPDFNWTTIHQSQDQPIKPIQQQDPTEDTTTPAAPTEVEGPPSSHLRSKTKQQHTSHKQEQPEHNPTPMDPLECNPAEIEVNSIDIIPKSYSWMRLTRFLSYTGKTIDDSAPVSLP